MLRRRDTETPHHPSSSLSCSSHKHSAPVTPPHPTTSHSTPYPTPSPPHPPHLLSGGLDASYWALVCLQINASHRVSDQWDYISYETGRSRGRWSRKGNGGSSLREAERRLQWQSNSLGGKSGDEGENWGLGKKKKRKEKSQCQMGWRMRSLLIFCLHSLQRISSKHRPWCLSFSQCEDEDALFGDMEMNGKLCNTACLYDAGIFPKCLWKITWPQRTRCFSETASWRDRKSTKYLHMLSRKNVADWTHNEDKRFIFIPVFWHSKEYKNIKNTFVLYLRGLSTWQWNQYVFVVFMKCIFSIVWAWKNLTRPMQLVL